MKAILPPEHPDELRAFVDRLTDNGWPVAPVVAGEKRCTARAWQKRAFAGDEFVRRRVKDGFAPGVGLRLRGLLMVDIDADDVAMSRRLRKLAEATLGETPMVRTGRAPRLAMFYRVERAWTWEPREAPVDVKAGRQQMGVAFGRHPDTGRGYSWEGDSPLDIPLDAVPLATATGLDAFRRAVEGLFPKVARSTGPSANARPAPRQPRARGKATDGREAVLRDAVCSTIGAALAAGLPLDRDLIEGEAWERFLDKADVSTRKGNGRGYWSAADVRRHVAYSLRPDRLARIKPMCTSRTWTADASRALMMAIRRDPRCSATIRDVARVMLDALNPGRDPREVCTMSSVTIGAKAGVIAKTARAARRTLIELGYFLEVERGQARGRKATRPGKATTVRPNPAWIEGRAPVEIPEGDSVVVPFRGPQKCSLANISQVAEIAIEIENVHRPQGHNPLPVNLTTASPGPMAAVRTIRPPCEAAQPDLFGGEIPIGGNHSDFGAWLRGERQRVGLSQAALGAMIGLRQPHIANVERGHDTLSGERRRQVVEILHGRGAA